MGNQKSLYKTYFNEVYLKKEEPKQKHLVHYSSNEDHAVSPLQFHSISEVSKNSEGIASTRVNINLHKSIQNNKSLIGQISPDQAWRSSSKFQKTFKIIIDQNYTLTITVPNNLPLATDDDIISPKNALNQTAQIHTCGWLIEQVEKQYAQLIKKQKYDPLAKSKLRKKLIVALKTVDKNESIDYWLTQHTRPLKPLPSGLVLEPHYSKIIQNKPKAVCANDFEMLKVIGKGGFSKVFMVRKKDTGFIYAMKVMKKDQVTNESKLKQIMNERTIMEQLPDHPFVTKLHYAFQSKENLHFILDFCTGGEMFYHLQKNGRFPEFLAKFYFAEILLGIEFLHENNIVYRDMKPENVLIEVDGHIKLADFGLSKQFKRDERSFSYCGSPEYMCPEILKREGHNHMVDYYTLGAILFEMLTGLPPFYTNNKSEMTKRILDAQLTFPSYINSEAVSLMTSLLERNPLKRLGSKTGVEEIKQHDWCKDIDWDLIFHKKITPPWKPRLDQSNFDPEYTQLPLNFDDNFKRALQGDREFSFYYESPCQSMTVTENSIYDSNPDLSNHEIFLQSGSSKKLLEHFQKQNLMNQYSFIDPMNFNEIYMQQQQILEMNTQMALKINQTLHRDESILRIEYNQESGLTNFRGFSFFGESEQELEVKKQLIKYTKLRNNLKRKLKTIQNEQGIIRQSDLLDISLGSPNSSLGSIVCQTVLPTPPAMEEASSITSQPGLKFQNYIESDSANSPLSPQFRINGIIDKNMKQHLIFSKLEETKVDKNLYKSFQAEQQQTQKKEQLSKSNFDISEQDPSSKQNPVSIKEGDSQINMDLSIKEDSSNCESVAEERDNDDEQKCVHKSKNYSHQNLTTIMEHSVTIEPLIDQGNSKEILEESKEEISLNEEQDLKNIKFILFQNLNVAKNKKKVTKTEREKGHGGKKMLKTSKKIENQRSRPNQLTQKQDKAIGLISSTVMQKSIVANNSKNTQQTSSISNTNTSFRDQHLEKTGTDYQSTKHTFDHHSVRSTNKKIFEDEQLVIFNDQQQLNQTQDLIKSSSMMPETQRYQTPNSPKQSKPPQTTAKKNNKRFVQQNIKQPNLEIDIESSLLSQINLKQIESEYYFGDNLSSGDVMKIPKTTKYDARNKEHLLFEIEKSDDTMNSIKQTPKNSNNQGFQFAQQQLGLTQERKVSQHQKQKSDDCNYFQYEDFLKKSAQNVNLSQLTQKVSNEQASTPKSSASLSLSQFCQGAELHLSKFSGTNSKMATQKKPLDDELKVDLQNFDQKEQVISKSAAKKSIVKQNSLKKGILSTASTTFLSRPQYGGMLMTYQKKILSKPQQFKQGEGQNAQNNSSANKKSHNSYQKTSTVQKTMVNQKMMSSQPGSTKRSKSIKFTFPVTESALSHKKQGNKNSLFYKPPQTQKYDSAFHKKSPTNLEQPLLALDDCDDEEHLKNTKTILLKMPKTTMNKITKKGFFQERCALCTSMPCCPEHCCNWDTCKCKDCEYCVVKKQVPDQSDKAQPDIFIKATGHEEIMKLNTKKKPYQKQEKIEDEKDKPQEQTKTEDGALITNFEVNVEEEILYAGGIKGIRALKQQRDQLEDVSELEESKYQYSKYEERKK